MIEYEKEGAAIVDRRIQGITPQNKLDEWKKKNTKGGLFKKTVPQASFHTPPDLHFDEITYCDISPQDRQDYFVMVGRDGQRRTLIVNSNIALNGDFESIEVERETMRYSSERGLTFLATTKNAEGNTSLYHIGSKTGTNAIALDQNEIDVVSEQRWLLLGEKSHDFNRVIHSSKNLTTVLYLDQQGRVLYRFSVDQRIPASDISIWSQSQDRTTTIWSLEKTDPQAEGDTATKPRLLNFYRNAQLIAEDVLGTTLNGRICFSDDLTSYVAASETKDHITEIKKDGESLYSTPDKLQWLSASDDLSLVAAGFSIAPEGTEPQSQILYITPYASGLTEPVDHKPFTPYIRFDENSMSIDFKRNGIPRTLTIKPKGSPQETSAEPESVA